MWWRSTLTVMPGQLRASWSLPLSTIMAVSLCALICIVLCWLYGLVHITCNDFWWSKNKFIGTCIDIPIIRRNDISYVPTVHMSIIHMWFVLTDTITPLFITKKEESNFYEKTYIMIPLCFGIVAFLILIIAVLLYMRRRRELIQMKGKVKFTIPGDV